jgi:Helicase conserved C-terminal domain
MPVLALMYPSWTLAELCDPLTAGAAIRDPDGALPALNDIIDWMEGRIGRALEEIVPGRPAAGAVDQRWYWAAPILLDLAQHEEITRSWFGQANLSKLWEVTAAEDTAAAETDVPPDDVNRWADHVDEARSLLGGRDALELGTPPGDLRNVLAWLALGGPGTTGLRAIQRVTGDSRNGHIAVQNAAGQIAHGLRSLFNQPEVTGSLQRSDDDETYWRRVLEYAGRGCLSAVLDEYAHMALEADSLAGKPIDQVAAGLAARMTSALTLQTATLRVDHITEDSETRLLRIDDHLGFRTAFAVRYGARGEEGVAADRNEKLQTAFNSPFWPIVLCTTSVGQEGLDFHPYCHSVVHWNLPSNPVDLEQREGRVHRYKGHAVRKNVAAKHRDAAFGPASNSDPWARMFQSAREDALGDDDLVPYWIYTIDGGAQIERHVPVLPDRCQSHADGTRSPIRGC